VQGRKGKSYLGKNGEKAINTRIIEEKKIGTMESGAQKEVSQGWG
jgi:hypothetical protein